MFRFRMPMVWVDPPKKEREGPIIPLTTPCPACGHKDCELAFDAALTKVKRRCKVCGCVVEQPPVAPDLFKAK